MLASLLQFLRSGSKKTYTLLLVGAVFVFTMLVAGQMISVIGSRQIIAPMTIQVVDTEGKEIDSVRRFMQLARAGNYTMILPSSNETDPWLVEGVFIKKLFVGIATDDIATIGAIDISLGDSHFHFEDSEAIQRWDVFDTDVVKAELYGLDLDSYIIFEVPNEVSLARSQIPVYTDFFGSLINWSGDQKVFLAPILNSIPLLILLLLFGGIVYRIWQTVQSRFSTETSPLPAQKQYITFVIVILLTLVSLSSLLAAIYVLYHPDVAQILRDSAEVYLPYFHKSFRPKPVERLQFILGTLATPFVLWFFYAFVSKKEMLKDALVRRWYPWVVSGVLYSLFAAVYFGLAMSGYLYINDSIFFDATWRYVYVLVVFPVALLLFLTKQTTSQRLIRALVALIVLLFGIIFFMNIFNLTNTFDAYTSDPVLYPVTQVMAGKSLLVNLTSFYGLYPLFLLPIFWVTGLSVLKFSVVMSVLICLSVLSLFFSMREIIKDQVLMYLGFITTIFYTLFASRIIPEQYLQYWPIRYVFPCLSILLVVYYFKQKSKLLYYLSFFVYAAGILWNFDVGIVVFISWIGVLVYQEISTVQKWKRVLIKVLRHLLVSAASLAVTIACFAGITYLQSGQLPDTSVWLQYQEIFLTGYLMIKMIPPPHMWTVIILVYIIGLLISASAFVRKEVTYTDTITFYLAVLGFGLFSYYEGQSSDVTLFRTSYPALILLVLFADMLWQRMSTYGIKAYGEFILFVGIMFILISAPFSILLNMRTYWDFTMQGVNAVTLTESTYFDNISFLKEHTEPGESIVIISSPNQAVYYAETGTVSEIDTTSLADIPFPEEMDRLIDFLQTNTDVTVFAEVPFSQFTVFDERIEPILSEQYQPVAESKSGIIRLERVIQQ